MTVPNLSGRTRVSLDFRCSVDEFYDADWSMPGDTCCHEMRKIEILYDDGAEMR